MKNTCRYIIAVCMVFFFSNAQSKDDDKYTALTCAGYYYTLSIFAPKFVQDLTVDQAVKASFAFRKQVDGEMYSTKSDQAYIDRWMELDKEITRPAKQEYIDVFRAKYEPTCRPLLQKAWCDAYREHSQNACPN